MTDIVTLNIGGTIFLTTKFTLTKFDGFFKTVLETRTLVHDKSGAFFIDRSPKHFDLILNFMRDGHVDIKKYLEDVEEIQKEAEYYLLDESVELCKNNQYPNKLRFIKSDEELFEVIYKPEKPVLVLFGPIPSEGCFYHPNLLEFQKNYVSKFEMYIRLKPFSKQMDGWSYGGYSKKGQFRSEFGTYYTLTEQLEKVVREFLSLEKR